MSSKLGHILALQKAFRVRQTPSPKTKAPSAPLLRRFWREYLVHYRGWKSSSDEWVRSARLRSHDAPKPELLPAGVWGGDEETISRCTSQGQLTREPSTVRAPSPRHPPPHPATRPLSTTRGVRTTGSGGARG